MALEIAKSLNLWLWIKTNHVKSKLVTFALRFLGRLLGT